MVANTFTDNATFSIPPARLFKSFILDDINFVPKIVPQDVQSLEYVQGDGGAGSIKLITFGKDAAYKGAKHRVDGVDKENFTYSHTIIEVIEPKVKNDSIESASFVLKFEPSAHGGSIVKVTATYHTKGGAHVSEELFKREAGHLFSILKAAEAYLAANHAAYN